MSDQADVTNSDEFTRDNGGFLTSDDWRTGLIPGVTFATRAVQYAVVDGLAVFEGCIVLGTVEEIERDTSALAAAAAGSPDDVGVEGIAITGARFRWPGGVMPFTINAALPNPQRVRDAIQHWETNTHLRFVERTAANAAQFPNFVEVIPSDGCWSQVGMRGRRQEIGLAAGCGTGSTIHEFGHAWGLWHEQSREDRDTFLTINWANIEPGREHNFNQHITDGDDIGRHDYGSIMHYGRFAFSRNNLPTIEPVQAGVTIGQRNGLSAGDIAAVRAMYPIVGNFGYDAGGWRVERHPRFLADITGDGRADIVGFGNAGVWVARAQGDGGFAAPQFVVDNFGYDAGGWRVERHPRFLADITGDGRADIVGFGNAGVWVARAQGDGGFAAPQFVVDNFGYDAGGWRVERHPRFLADITGDGRADIVGFGNAGVWVARAQGDGGFAAPQFVVDNFGYDAGGWRVERHPRFLADITGDGRADIVGFGNAGVWVARAQGDGGFAAPQFVVDNFGYDAGGWRVERHPRFLADITGDGRADIVGFGNAGVWVARAQGDGGFAAPQFVVDNFGYDAGGWRVERHPRFLADITGDGRADIVGFGNAGVWVARAQGDGGFAAPQFVVDNFGYDAGGWRVERHPRFLADITGDGRADIVGFGNAGVWVARAQGDGGFIT